MKAVDLSGMIFGKLTAKESMGARRHGGLVWRCVCECGNVKDVPSASLRSGGTRSCGCLFGKHMITHGMSKTPEYKVWCFMIQRCNNPKSDSYPLYGGRGISVCSRWEVFENFISDMGRRPDNSLSIERVDNERGYSPDNCKWDTHTAQARNTRKPKTNTSGIKGVSYMKQHQKYRAYIHVDRKFICLGLHQEKSGAAEARRLGEIKYWGFT